MRGFSLLLCCGWLGLYLTSTFTFAQELNISPISMTSNDLHSSRTLREDVEAKVSSPPAIHRIYDPLSGRFCEVISECNVCPVSEKEEVYCRETGHRLELGCPVSTDKNHPDVHAESEQREIRFKACTPVEKAHPMLRVVTFEIVMMGLLVGSFVLLQKEKRKHLSLFDLRKDPSQRNTLLGTTIHKTND